MKNSRIHGMCLLLCLMLLVTSIQPVLATTAEQTLDQLIEETKDKAGISHISVVVVDHEEEAFYGEADELALYQIGSMTKSFTALGILYLAQEGEIDLQEQIDTYISGFYVVYGEEKVIPTVNDLLYQLSGFTNSEKDYPSGEKGMPLAEWGEQICGSEIKTCPGESYAYSNVNYNLLGLIIENVSGQSYAEFMTENILEPLGLYHTYCGETFSNQRVFEGTRLGFGYTFPYAIEVRESTIPAGYFYSNITDMSRWLRIQMGEETVPGNYQRIIEQSHYIAADMDQSLSYFAGWDILGEQVIGHSGGTPNYSSRIMIDNQNKVGVCVLTNMNAAASTDSLCTRILDQLTGRAVSEFKYDVWCIFDWIFTVITILGVIVPVATSQLKNKKFYRKLVVGLGIGVNVITVALLIILPIIFAANWITILGIWAPISMTSGMLVLIVDCAISWIHMKKLL